MKRNKFDELIRQKFDDNDFAYNSTQWTKLAAELDKDQGRKKKILWLPFTIVATVTSIAASLAMVVSIASFLQHNDKGGRKLAVHKKVHNAGAVAAYRQPAAQQDDAQVVAMAIPNAMPAAVAPVAAIHSTTQVKDEGVKLQLQAPAPDVLAKNWAPVFRDQVYDAHEESKTGPAVASAPFSSQSLYTYQPEEAPKKAIKTMISLTGGYNYGAANTGYALGATAKRNLNDKVYVEGDVAFLNNNQTEQKQYTTVTTTTVSRTGPNHAMAAKLSSDATTGVDNIRTNTQVHTKDNNYNLYYAQVTPAVGYNVRKKLSVGMGADFQRMLQDNRPEINGTDKGVTKVLPVFDVGLVAKGECAVSKKIKAGVYYRQGINYLITPTNQYIERSYLQFQLKYTILNR